ncbi:MAG: hypothetical protein JEZ12_22270 [Desulfobacterium sp.]|nr:hypothetical protein [Desulfobacterium sp.]
MDRSLAETRRSMAGPWISPICPLAPPTASEASSTAGKPPVALRHLDEYGGSIENRGRIICETLEAVRKEVGTEYPVFIKMHCSHDWDEKGLTEDESLYVAKELEKRGISGIEFSGGNLDTQNYPNAGPARIKILKPDLGGISFLTTCLQVSRCSVLCSCLLDKASIPV